MEPTRRQEARAHEIAHQLTGGRYTRAIWKSILALVIADEQPDTRPEGTRGPAPGARQVLGPATPATEAKPKDPDQGALW